MVALAVALFSLLFSGLSPGSSVYAQQAGGPGAPPGAQTAALPHLYLPIITAPQPSQPPGEPDPIPQPTPGAPLRTTALIHAPYLEELAFGEAAIFWFGQVADNETYTDVRVSYNQEMLWVHLSVFDEILLYDPTPDASTLLEWDAASLFLNLDGAHGAAANARTYRFDSQLTWWEERPAWQAAYRGSGSGYTPAPLPFTTYSGWRGNAPNDGSWDQGWTLEFQIPFASLGLAGPPATGAGWGMAIKVFDRDFPDRLPESIQAWPNKMAENQPQTWGELGYGLPAYQPVAGLQTAEKVTIRHKLNGQSVQDGMVGGSSTCAEGVSSLWQNWGQLNYAGADQVNVQNEGDVSDWLCFSKFYITFPLDSLPENRGVISASLTLYSIGNAGGGSYGPPDPAMIQVMMADQDWNEATLNWNNGPQVLENIARRWVDPIGVWPGWPGVPQTWDLSVAVSQAYAAGQPLRLVVYSAAGRLHTGRYFSSSDMGDWNAAGRPTLNVQLGKP